MKIWLQRRLYRIGVYYGFHKSRTIKYVFPIFPLMLISVSLLGAVSVGSLTSSYVTLETNTKLVTKGREATVDVYVYAHEPVNAVEIEVDFPPQLQVRGIDAGESVITLWTQEPYVENNTVFLRGGTFRKGFKGQHLIARIDAVAETGGVAKVAIGDSRLLVGDGTGNEAAQDLASGVRALSIQIADNEGVLVLDDGTTISAGIITDIDGDGVVDLRDISSFMAAWNDRSTIFDFSGDGKMTFRDFGIILADSFLR